MKKKRRLRAFSGFIAFAFVFMVFSFSFAPKAHAAEANLSVTYGVHSRYEGTNQRDGTTPISNSEVRISRKIVYNGIDRIQRVSPYIITDGNFWHTGPCKIYFSFVPTAYTQTGNVVGGNPLTAAFWKTSYDNDRGVRVEETGLTNITEFSASDSGLITIGNKGYACEAAFVGSEEHPITRLYVGGNAQGGYGWSSQTMGTSMDETDTELGDLTFFIGANFLSIRVVTTENTAELELLDSVSNQLIQQNDLLLSMKGEIVALLQDIYEMTGDIWTAQDLANQYLSAIRDLTDQIVGFQSDIYWEIYNGFAMMEYMIHTNTTTIEAAIEAQTAAIIAYLEAYFNTGNEVPDDTEAQQDEAQAILDTMAGMDKPDVETIVPTLGDISNDGLSGALSSVFSNNLIVTMMTLSVSLAFGAYVLFGKRG